MYMPVGICKLGLSVLNFPEHSQLFLRYEAQGRMLCTDFLSWARSSDTSFRAGDGTHHFPSQNCCSTGGNLKLEREREIVWLCSPDKSSDPAQRLGISNLCTGTTSAFCIIFSESCTNSARLLPQQQKRCLISHNISHPHTINTLYFCCTCC